MAGRIAVGRGLAITYKMQVQQPTKTFCNFMQKRLAKNIPAIIAETGYDRKTICKYIDMTDFNTPEPKVKDPKNICPNLDEYKPLIDNWLAEDRKAPRKNSFTQISNYLS